MNILERAILVVIKYKVARWFRLEMSLAKRGDTIKSTDLSPYKSWPDPNKIPSGKEVPFSLKNIDTVGKSLRSCISEGMLAISSIKNNPTDFKLLISSGELADFESEAKQLGVGSIGYCKLPANLIFKNRAVLYDHAIVITMEMDALSIAQAPSLTTFKMVMGTYNTLGIITNQLTQKLRKAGYQAQASHPLGGLVLYPPLAVEAGLGWFGSHGLLITPEFGPRQRIAAIFANIENLPLNRENKHSWIGEFCKKCGKCIRTCPQSAILKDPIVHISGRITKIDRAKCLPAFVSNEGCTICVKECLFSKVDYDTLHSRLNKQEHNT